ncbi:MAG: signal recognition particle-docking protein FtsY [Thaumarchaeota archaeon]|nr:MAG: signal recognition particle-docking protein FtsY [Nitrososphaerota archaeon]
MLDGLRNAFREVIEELKTRSLSEEEIQRYIEDFKLRLIANDVAVEVADRLGEELSQRLKNLKLKRFKDESDEILKQFSLIIDSVLKEGDLNEFLRRIEEKKRMGEPFVILFVGPNGSGKTTTIAKLALFLKKLGYQSIIAASDTFRAGAIEQLEKLAKSIGVRMISQRYGADPAAVAMDAVISARANKIPVVLIDTAGRTEVNRNLLEEMRKIKRVVKPDLVIYVGDALAGNAAIEQAKNFDEYVGIDYVILTKLDADARGGSAISISYQTSKPILFVGTGQSLEELKPFTKDLIKSALISP